MNFDAIYMFPCRGYNLFSYLQIMLVRIAFVLYVLNLGINISLQTYMSSMDDVKVLPFVTLYGERKSLHLVQDYYRLIQVVNVKPIADHIGYIANGFAMVRSAYKGHSNPLMFGEHDLENKLKFLMEQLATSLEAGIQLLPHEQGCLQRAERDIDMGVDPVNTAALFPAVGKLFSWITGSLSSDAGNVINQNYHKNQKID